MINWQFKYEFGESAFLNIPAYDVYRKLSKEPTIGGGKINNMFFLLRFTDMFTKRRIKIYPFIQTGDSGAVEESAIKSNFSFFIRAFDNLGSIQYNEDLLTGQVNIQNVFSGNLYKLEIIETITHLVHQKLDYCIRRYLT